MRGSRSLGRRLRCALPGQLVVGQEGFRRRGSDAVVANPFLTGGLLFDARYLLVFTHRRKFSFPTTRRRWPQQVWPPSIHFPRKRLSYTHSTSSPVTGLGDSFGPPQFRRSLG